MRERIGLAVVTLFTVAAMNASTAAAPTISCSGKHTVFDAQAATDAVTTLYDMNGANGAPLGIDPTPVMSQTFAVSGNQPSCVVAHLSFHPLESETIGDAWQIFQVTLDGSPMFGHSTVCVTGGQNVPCVLTSTASLSNSYSLIMPNVGPGTHVVEVRAAGCCTGKGAYISGLNLVVDHR